MIYNLKFEAKPKGPGSDSVMTLFAQMHTNLNQEDTHVSLCCLFNNNFTEVAADCLDCFPKLTDGDEKNGEGEKDVTAIFDPVRRIQKVKPRDEGIDLTSKEQKVLVGHHCVAVAKQALEWYKKNKMHDEDAAPEFMNMEDFDYTGRRGYVFTLRFRAMPNVSDDSSPKVFVAVVHMESKLYDEKIDAHTSYCSLYDPNHPAVANSCAVCEPEVKFKPACLFRKMPWLIEYVLQMYDVGS